jgi:hypothetical protein
MNYDFRSIVEKLAILEGRIDPSNNEPLPEAKQKKPALFNNLKKKEESAMPMVGGVEFAEDKMKEDVLGQVKASLADYLKSAEENIKQDTDLIAKKKQDLDLKKKELKDLELQTRAREVEEAIPMTLEDHQKLEVGDRICVIGPNDHQGEFGNITEFSPSGKFVVVDLGYGKEISMHISDVEFHDDQEDWEDEDDFDSSEQQGFKDQVEEDPNQTPSQGEAPAGMTDPTYAESAPVRTTNVEWTSGGGSVLVEIHGDERDGFCIKRAGKELPTRFKSLEEAEIALEMFTARRKAQLATEESADYIDEA